MPICVSCAGHGDSAYQALYTREPPSARHFVRRTLVRLQRPSAWAAFDLAGWCQAGVPGLSDTQNTLSGTTPFNAHFGVQLDQ